VSYLKRLLELSVLVASASCAPPNAELFNLVDGAGYRPPATSIANNSDELFIALALSGGGTRAAAFSYGVLRELDRHSVNMAGDTRSLLDETDLISAVSGGSFTAAHFALFGKRRLFEEYKKRFLYRNIQLELITRALNPINLVRLSLPWFSRSDLAAGFYDETIFDGKQFRDMPSKPYVVLNATVMSEGIGFEFTQDQFDIIGSNLATLPVARAVAASAAFPFLLTPIALKNYGVKSGPKGPHEPWWLANSADIGTKTADRACYRWARGWKELENNIEHPYVQLLDGGLADNLGTRYIARSLLYPTFWLNRLIQSRTIKKLVLIAVNAQGAPGRAVDKSRQAGFINTLVATGSVSMDNYTDESINLLERVVNSFRKNPEGGPTYVTEEPDCGRKQTCQCFAQIPWKGNLKVYLLTVEFDGEHNPEVRRRLESIGTNFNLKARDVDFIVDEGAKLLSEHPCFELLSRHLSSEGH